MEADCIAFHSSTLMGKDQKSKLNQLLQTLLDSSESHQFRNPVDWQAFGLLDYPMIIKKPMDLNTVKRNLNNNNYNEVQSCLTDIQLIWDNCKTYNAKDNWIYKLGDKLQKMFKKMIKNYLPFVVIDGSSLMKKMTKKQKQPKKTIPKVSQQEPKDYNELRSKPQQQEPQIPQQDPITRKRRQFLYFAPLCSPQQMGIIFLLLKKHCPAAIVLTQEGLANINVENIEDQMIDRLMEQFDMWGIGYAPVTTKRK